MSGFGEETAFAPRTTNRLLGTKSLNLERFINRSDLVRKLEGAGFSLLPGVLMRALGHQLAFYEAGQAPGGKVTTLSDNDYISGFKTPISKFFQLYCYQEQLSQEEQLQLAYFRAFGTQLVAAETTVKQDGQLVRKVHEAISLCPTLKNTHGAWVAQEKIGHAFRFSWEGPIEKRPPTERMEFYRYLRSANGLVADAIPYSLKFSSELKDGYGPNYFPARADLFMPVVCCPANPGQQLED